jgi:hypothetical protein
MPETGSTERITRLEGVVEGLKIGLEDHVRRFGELNASVDRMKASVDQLVNARAEQVGAARAIAELAERRSRELSEENATRSRTLTVISLVAGAAYTLVNVAIQKHWF